MRIKTRICFLDEAINRIIQSMTERRITRTVDEIKKHGGLNSTAFWNFKKSMESKSQTTIQYAMKNEKGEIDEENTLEIYKNHYENLLKTRKGKTK